jgi:tRNA (guanine-N7-)-methyltransferase
MAGTPNKRQKREAYRQAALGAREGGSGTGGDGEGQGRGGGGPIDLPKKKFYRQRAHANPFSDHALA